MKRRNFLKSIIGAASVAAVPSLVLAKPEGKTTIRTGLPKAYFNHMDKFKREYEGDNTSIWNVSWDKDGPSKLQPIRSAKDIEALREQHRKDMEKTMLGMGLI